MNNQPRYIEHAAMLGIWLSAVAVSGIGPTDQLTWFFEVLPVLLVIPLMAATYRTFPLTPLLYRLAFIHGLILILGAHYTYAQVPLGFWLQDAFELSRNPYDRIGHFAQGFVPAILTREILLRKTHLQTGRMLFFLVLCVCLAFSAFYEMLEWWAAVALGAEADAFLGTQGDPWDTQWDMFLALSGAAIAQILLSRRHDRQITAL